MKKIAIIIPSLKFGGGAEKAASNLGTQLHRKGYDVSFFTFYDTQEKYPFEGGYNSLNEKQTNNPLIKITKLFIRAYKIAKFCKKKHIKTCISFMEDANFSTILSKSFGNQAKLNIAIRHSLFEYGKGLYCRLIRYLYKIADNIIIMTKHEKDNLIKNFNIDQKRIKTIYNAINIEGIENLKKEDIGKYKPLFENGKFTFITTGRLNKIKNQELLIKTFDVFNQKHKKTQLIILGDGELRNNLINLTKNINIHFLGNQSNVYKFLNHADCFILTSFSEAFPNVILEAMACKLPVISSETQGGREIIGDNIYGINFENNKAKKLLESMEQIYSKTESRNHYKQKSLERSKDFQMKNILDKWEEIL